MTPIYIAEHCHSTYSKDGESVLAEMVQKAKQCSIQYLYLTEHAEDVTEVQWKQLVQECKDYSQGIEVIPGLEFRTKEGLHILGLSLQNYYLAQTCVEACTFIRSQGGFSIVAHPNYYPALLDPPCFDFNLVDAIEIWTAKADTQHCPRKKILKLYQQLKRTYPHLLPVAGLDAHGTYMLSGPRMQIQLDQLEGQKTPLDLLREKKYILVGGAVKLNSEGMPLQGQWRITVFHSIFFVKRILQKIAKRWRKQGLPELNLLRKLFRKIF
ncbi:MAG: PHP domain-containing protein [Planctomycetota bacterium]